MAEIGGKLRLLSALQGTRLLPSAARLSRLSCSINQSGETRASNGKGAR
jgi:hypothetical protein